MTAIARSLCNDLADDFGWLEAHAREKPEREAKAIPLRFASALVRNTIAPTVDGVAAPPLHIAVVGGAGTGKSTIANFLCGAIAAEANPQAGFTRHPVAYTHAGGSSGWPSHSGFLGSLKLLATPSPSSIDEDFYQIRKLPVGGDSWLLERFVVWDCPDMTTWAATGYAPRLLEVAGLADVVVFVASDERYNDAVPTEYLRLFLQAGKPVVVVMTKMKPENANELTAHFRTAVLSDLPKGRIAVLSVPFLTADELADPIFKAGRYRIPLVNQVNVLGESARELRQQNAQAAVAYLQNHADTLMGSARDDLNALDDWAKLVRGGQAEFQNRYQREFLSTAKFHRFDEALVRLIDLLELPGVGKFLSSALYVVRTPYRLLKGFLGKVFGPPETAAIPEQPVLEGAYTAWIDQIRATALANEHRHELWAMVHGGFEGNLGDQARERFTLAMRSFQTGQTEEIDNTARAIYEDLEKSPNALNAMRGGKFALDVAAIAASIAMGGIGWSDLILVPLAASMSQQLVEWAGAGYVELQRDAARQRQKDMVTKHLADPLGEWLLKWPSSGGSNFERLQLALNRIPSHIRGLALAVNPEGP